MTILLMCFLSCQLEPHCATCYDTNTRAEWRVCEPTALELRNVLYDRPLNVICYED